MAKLSAFLLLSSAVTSQAHMELRYPPPRRSRFMVGSSQPIDYDMVAPLAADGSGLTCKRYAAGSPVATFAAGETVQVQAAGGTFHGGGHCQFSVSYDGQTFVVLQSAMKTCFIGTGLNFNVTLPPTTPACDRCTFAWTWVNAIGNRELYMNCADVRITNSLPLADQILTGRNYTVANQPGYPTIPEFPVPNASYDGSDLYAAAPLVTVYGYKTGAVVSAAPAPSSVPVAPSPSAAASRAAVPSASASQSKQPAPSSTSTASAIVKPSASSVAQPSSTSTASALVKPSSTSTASAAAQSTGAAAPLVCSASNNGASACSGSTTYNVCSNGFTYAMQCPAGTTCDMSSGWARCDSVPASGASVCTTNQYRCLASGGYEQCGNNVWFQRACAPGTTCKAIANGEIACVV